MKLKNITESISSKVYHATNFHTAKDILVSNIFTLSSLLANKEEGGINSKNYFYMSVSRSRFGSFHYPPKKTDFVLFNLDGNKLNNNFSGNAHNYYDSENAQSDEMEDRILSKYPEIKNAISYIETIELYIPQAPQSHLSQIDMYKDAYDIINISLTSNIPVKLFINNKDFSANKTPYVNGKALEYVNSWISNNGNKIESQKKKQRDYVAVSLNMVYKLITNNNNNFDKKEQMEYMDFMNPSNTEQFIENLLKDLNIRYYSDEVRYITNWARQHKLKNIEELVNFLRVEYTK